MQSSHWPSPLKAILIGISWICAAAISSIQSVDLERLPGVGRYTAGAVACFAYERVAATVDTNVARVIRRVFHPRLRDKPVPKQVWAMAEEILPREGKRAWEINQALMELGAVVCTARVARCEICPVRGACGTGRAQKVKRER